MTSYAGEYAMSESDVVVKHVEPLRIAALSETTRFGVSVVDLFVRARASPWTRPGCRARRRCRHFSTPP